MKVGVLTLFPQMFPGPLNYSIIGRGLINKIWELEVIDLYANGKHIDDKPFGGGAGMLIRADIITEFIDKNMVNYDVIAFLVPFGKVFNQKICNELQNINSILFVCGRYEGIDYRVYEYCEKKYSTMFLSMGNYILCGGEIAAMAIIEAIVRLKVIKKERSFLEESFSDFNNNLLEAPQYTKPVKWENMEVEEVLRSGHHGKIRQWHKQKSIEQTLKYRPELIEVE